MTDGPTICFKENPVSDEVQIHLVTTGMDPVDSVKTLAVFREAGFKVIVDDSSFVSRIHEGKIIMVVSPVEEVNPLLILEIRSTKVTMGVVDFREGTIVGDLSKQGEVVPNTGAFFSDRETYNAARRIISNRVNDLARSTRNKGYGLFFFFIVIAIFLLILSCCFDNSAGLLILGFVLLFVAYAILIGCCY